MLGLKEGQCEQVAMASAGNLLCATKLLEVLYDQTARGMPIEKAPARDVDWAGAAA